MKDNRDKIGKEIINSVTKLPHEIWVLSPRIGKSKLGIEIIKKFKCKSVLWVTSSAKLRDVDIIEEFVKWKAKKYLPKTTVIHYNTLSKTTGKFDLIILDEFQSITEDNTVNFFNGSLNNTPILAMSGTMPKHEEKLDILRKLKLKVTKEISIDDAVEQDLVADYSIKVVEIPMESFKKTVKAGTKAKPFMTTEASNYDYLSKKVNKAMFMNNSKLTQFAILNRMRAIYNSPSKFEVAKQLIKKLDGRKIIFTGSIKQAEAISPYTYHSQTDDTHLNQFLNEEIDLLSLVNSGGTGFTYKNVQHFILVKVDSDKAGGTTQKLAKQNLAIPI